MKFCIPLILIFVTLVSANPIDFWSDNEEKQIIADCAKEFDIQFPEFMQELDDSYKLPYANTTGPCFSKCVFEKLGYFDNESGFKVEAIENKFKSKSKSNDQQYVANIYGWQIDSVKCAKRTNEENYVNSCERAFRGAECLVKERREKHFEHDTETKHKIECAEELNITTSQLKQFEDTYKMNRTNPTFHCLTKCIYEKNGVLEKNNVVGNLVVQFILNEFTIGSWKVPSADHLVALEKCTKDQHEMANINDCERVFRGVECIWDTVDKYIVKMYPDEYVRTK